MVEKIKLGVIYNDKYYIGSFSFLNIFAKNLTGQIININDIKDLDDFGFSVEMDDDYNVFLFINKDSKLLKGAV